MQFVGTANHWPGVRANLIDRCRIETAEVADRIDGDAPAQRYRSCSTLLERRVVRKGVWIGIEYLMTERRGLASVPRYQLDATGHNVAEHSEPPVEIHRLTQAIGHRLAHQWVIRNFDILRPIFETRRLRRKHCSQQIFCTKTLKIGRNPFAPAHAEHGQRPCNIPAPSRAEQRNRKQRLGEHMFAIVWAKHAEHLVDRKAVLRAKRQYDAVIIRRGLQFEIKTTTKALPQCQTPRPINSAAKRCMNDQLHSTRLIEESFENDLLLRRNQANGSSLGRHVLNRLARGPTGDATFVG